MYGTRVREPVTFLIRTMVISRCQCAEIKPHSSRNTAMRCNVRSKRMVHKLRMSPKLLRFAAFFLDAGAELSVWENVLLFPCLVVV